MYVTSRFLIVSQSRFDGAFTVVDTSNSIRHYISGPSLEKAEPGSLIGREFVATLSPYIMMAREIKFINLEIMNGD